MTTPKTPHAPRETDDISKPEGEQDRRLAEEILKRPHSKAFDAALEAVEKMDSPTKH